MWRHSWLQAFYEITPFVFEKGILSLSTTTFCFVFAEECFDLAFDGFGIMIQR